LPFILTVKISVRP
jgi:hypothetical protein